MKKVCLIFSLFTVTLIMSQSRGEASKEVTIGKQVWMIKNLNVDKFRNGDPIPHAKTDEEWKKAAEGQPAWCYYDNDPSNGEKYGKLYNWYAVNDPRGLAPKGWHIPSDAEWTSLTEHLGGDDAAGTKMKISNSYFAPNANKSGFSGLMGGARGYNGRFDDFGYDSYLWSSTEKSTFRAWNRDMSRVSTKVNRRHFYKGVGYSVRCLRN